MRASQLARAVIVIISIDVCATKGCTKGWFGENCKYKCQCADDKCDINGLCASDVKCKRGWFGPLCQYHNLLNLTTVSVSPMGLKLLANTDKCPKNKTSTTVEVDLKDQYFMQWIRLIGKEKVTDMAGFDPMNITFKRNPKDAVINRCLNPKTYVQRDKNLIDVVCDLKDTFSVVNITGDIVRNICTIQISGGRNVALRQFARQSSNYFNHDGSQGLNFSQASNAVDGNTGSFEERTCTHTTDGNRDKNPNWNLTLAMQHLVHRYILYNRPSQGDRLRNFQLMSYSPERKLIFNYTGPNESRPSYLITTVPSLVPLTYIHVFAGYNASLFLTLCELEAFGDSYCSGNNFGLECNRSCNCDDRSEKCFVATGSCVSGCASGFYGEACSNECPLNRWGVDCLQPCNIQCLNDTCHSVTGSCAHGCDPGYHGHDCSQLLEESQMLAVALVVPLVTCLLILFTIAYIFWKRRNNKNGKKEVKAFDTSAKFSSEKHTKRTSFNTSDSDGQSESSPSKSVSENSLTYVNEVKLPPDTSIQVKDLQQFLRSHDTNYFLEQFKNIPIPTDVSMKVGQSLDNRQKNRYKDICTYDHSRVNLEINTLKNEGAYINASYIEGYKNEEKLIASQGPNAVILNDFVRMLWEQKVEKVVMLTNLTEDGKIKCERYWPEDGEKEFGRITIRLTTTQTFADYTIRRLELIKAGHPTQYIKHFHFTSWPDKGVPRTPWSLVDFEERVFVEQTLKPVVVHCSAGVGRTGTFIALRHVMKEAQDTGRVDFFKTVGKMRQARVMMIQTAEQYEFLHRAALVAITFLGTTVTAEDIGSITETLEMKTVTGRTQLKKQFQDVCTVSEDVCEDEPESNQEEDVIYQNAANNAEPMSKYAFVKSRAMYRLRLTSEPESTGETINAVLVSSFTKKENYILTHIPLFSTVADFWLLAILYDVSVLIVFDDLKENDASYLPTRTEEPLVATPFVINTKPVNESDHWAEIEVKVKVEKNKGANLGVGSGSYYFTHFKTSFQDFNPKEILTILKQTRQIVSSTAGRVMFMCRNGATYSGLACVLTLLLDRMDHDNCLTVPNVVGAVKSIRPEVIPTLEQYRTLYLALQRYSETTASYTNLNKAATFPAA
ncbi:unnamed protein product [Lymnaea stagnalis]|uniref:protein-tyrosine-phosphatase n=1 Tax=Lymnaea stagnalis TaxID=6523 RepID=A0AAV2HY14_LYMST